MRDPKETRAAAADGSFDCMDELAKLTARLRAAQDQISSDLQKNRITLRTVLQSLPVGAWITDSNGVIVESNEVANVIWGAEGTLAEAAARHGERGGYDAQTGEPIPAEEWPVRRAVRLGESTFNRVITIDRYDGSQTTVQFSAVPVYDPEGVLTGAVAVIQDVTERERLIDQLAHEHSKLLTLVNSIFDEVWFFDAGGKLVLCNPAVKQNLGIDPIEEQALDIPQIVERLEWENLAPGRFEEDRSVVWRALRGEVITDEEEVLVHRKSGERMYRRLNAAPLYSDQGEILGALVVARELTAHKMESAALQRANAELEKRIEERTQMLRERDQQYRQVIENIRDYAIFALDPEGRVVSWNAGAEAIKGYKAEEILGESYEKFFPPDVVRQGVPRVALERAAELGRFESEGWRVRKDGTRFWANSVLTALYDDQDGRLIGYAKVLRDMTRRKEADEALRRQTGFVHLQQQIASAANQAASAEEAIQYALERVCNHGGWAIGHMLGLAPDGSGALVTTGNWYITDAERFAEFRQASDGLRFYPGDGLPGRVMASVEPLWVEDVTRDFSSLRRAWAERAGLHTCVALPVLAGDKVVGVMEFFSDQVRPYDPPLQDVLAFIGTQIGRVIERQESERALRESEARFRTIFEGAPTGIEMVDLQGGLLAWNPAIERILGFPQVGGKDGLRSEEQAGPVNVITAPPVANQSASLAGMSEPFSLSPRRNEALFDRLRNGEINSYRLERPYSRADGGQIWGRLSVSLVRDTANQPLYAIGILEDDTERKQMEAGLNELKRRQIEGREVERLHLSQELHDGPVQDLIGLAFHLKAFSDTLPEEVEREPLAEIRRGIQQVVRTLRTICGELRPSTLTPFGLEKAIRSHAAEFQEHYPDIEVGLDLMPDGQSLPESHRLALFRIYQQALNNIRRHANARHILVRLVLDENQVVLTIEDDGKGFDKPDRWIDLAREGHLGLLGAFERAEAIGGGLNVSSTPGKGTRIQVRVPRQPVDQV